jgi:hypothetical protein
VRFQISHASTVPSRRRPDAARAATLVDVLEEPAHLRRGEVGRDRQPGARADLAGPSALDRLLAHVRGARVLPHDRIVRGTPGDGVPRDDRLALVGDPDREDAHGRRGAHRLGAHLADALEDLRRVVLDPAGPREDLPVLPVRGRDRSAVEVE